MPTLSVGTLLVQSSLGVWRYPENVDEVIVHVFLFVYIQITKNYIKMRIIVSLIILNLFCSTLNAKKWFDTNKNLSLGVMYGKIGASEEISQNAWGLNLQIFGLYFDCMGKPRKHGNDVAIDKWKETEAVSYHFGYQIPIVEYVRIIPIIGYYSVKTGTTDGYNWSVTQNGISNAFNIDKKNCGMDCGGVLVLNYSFVCLYGAYTKHNQFYGGVGIEYRF